MAMSKETQGGTVEKIEGRLSEEAVADGTGDAEARVELGRRRWVERF
jgi:hypothetical protein